MTDPDAARSTFRLPGPGRPGSSVHVILPLTCEASGTASETITNAAGYPNYNNKSWSWPYQYQVKIDKANCAVTVTVKVKLKGVAVTDAQKAAWKSAVEGKWSNRAVLQCTSCSCPLGLPIQIVLQYVDSGQHYEVTAQASGTVQRGITGVGGGTTGMTEWGVDETVDMTHEFGHMLGNVEEYFTTNGVDYTNGGKKRGFRDADGGIMNNPANYPLQSNYETIRAQVAKCLGGANCTIGAPQVGDFPAPSSDTAVA